MKNIKSYGEFLNEAQTIYSEVGDDIIIKAYSNKDQESIKAVNGKKISLYQFKIVSEKNQTNLDNFSKFMKDNNMTIDTKSIAPLLNHPQDYSWLNKYFIKTGYMTLDQLKKLPDVVKRTQENIASDKNTWNQENYNKVGYNMKVDGIELGNFIKQLT